MYTANFNPFGLVSGAFGAVGGAISSTGNAMGSFVLNPFGIFGANGEKKPKATIFQCFTNLVTSTQQSINLVGKMVQACSVNIQGDMGALGSTMLNIADNLSGNVVQKWFSTGCDYNKGFQACIQTVSDRSEELS